MTARNVGVNAAALVLAVPALMTATTPEFGASAQARRMRAGDRVRVTADTATLHARCDDNAPSRALLRAGDVVEVEGVVDGWVTVILEDGSESGCVRRAVLDATALPPDPEARRARQQTASRDAGQGSAPVVGGALYGHAGRHAFTATRSFDAVFGSTDANVFGGGGQVNIEAGALRGVFFGVDVTRIREEGQRVFVFGGDVFPLGIPLTMIATPIEFTGGYRVPLGGARRADRSFGVVPYGGGGVGVLLYKEEADFAEAGEDVDERFTTYHVLGGVEFPFLHVLGVFVEAHYRWVPDALGAGGVSDEFNETNLGGTTFRVKFGVAF
jgi:hypothetical protein